MMQDPRPPTVACVDAKAAALRPVGYFTERRGRADWPAFDRLVAFGQVGSRVTLRVGSGPLSGSYDKRFRLYIALLADSM